MNEKSAEQTILEHLRKEQTCFKKLIEKLYAQKEAIDAEDEAKLLEILEGKNALIEAFQKLDSEIENQLRTLTPKMTQRLAQKAEAIKSDLEHGLRTIIGLEEECEKEIGSKMNRIQEKILGLKKGKTIAKGYGTVPRIRPIISRNI